MSFSTKIGRNFAPSFGVPLIDRSCPSVIMEPHLGFSYHKEEVLVGCVPLHLGLASLSAQPCESGNGISIDDPVEVVLLDIRQSEYQGKELADIVRTLLEGSAMEDLGAGVCYHAAELHHARVAATRRIHR